MDTTVQVGGQNQQPQPAADPQPRQAARRRPATRRQVGGQNQQLQPAVDSQPRQAQRPRPKRASRRAAGAQPVPPAADDDGAQGQQAAGAQPVPPAADNDDEEVIEGDGGTDGVDVQRGRGFHFTIFPDVTDHYLGPNVPVQDHLMKYPFNFIMLVRLTAQLEAAPETGRMHIQGFAQTKEKFTRVNFARQICKSSTVHVEYIRKSAWVNYVYCTQKEVKDQQSGQWIAKRWPDTVPLFYGPQPRPPRDVKKRTNDVDPPPVLVQIQNLIRSGTTTKEIAEMYANTDIVLQKMANIEKYAALFRDSQVPVERSKTVMIFWGSPGTGKDTMIHQRFGIENVYTKACGGDKWFDHFDWKKHEVIVFSEFDPASMRQNGINLRYILDMCNDKNAILPVHYGSVKINCHTIIFTSNTCPFDWFIDDSSSNAETISAFFSRVSNIIHFSWTPCNCVPRQSTIGGAPNFTWTHVIEQDHRRERNVVVRCPRRHVPELDMMDALGATLGENLMRENIDEEYRWVVELEC